MSFLASNDELTSERGETTLVETTEKEVSEEALSPAETSLPVEQETEKTVSERDPDVVPEQEQTGNIFTC